VRRVLRDDGTLWLNLGDSYSGAGPSGASYQSETTKARAGQKRDGAFAISDTLAARGLTYAEKKPIPAPGLKAKDMVGIPWRVAFALQADGWYLRQDIIWHKPNPMPESVRDRCTKAHEYIFLLAKSERYYFDAKAIAEESVTKDGRKPYARGQVDGRGNGHDRGGGTLRTNRDQGARWNTEFRNKRSVWTVTTKPFKGAHFATFPPDLIEPCILAGCPEGGTVLDPFGGAGTTGLVANRLGRRALLLELNPAYVEIAAARISKDQAAIAANT
jgi:DNA modification methylase